MPYLHESRPDYPGQTTQGRAAVWKKPVEGHVRSGPFDTRWRVDPEFRETRL